MPATAMTVAMDDVFYDTKDFNYDSMEHRNPSVIHEGHLVYHLVWDKNGYLVCKRDKKGNPISSPRSLRDICIYSLVSDPRRLKKTDPLLLPTNVYPLLMTEAILVRDPTIIEWVVSAWPTRVMRIYDLVPLEDSIDKYYLTTPIGKNKMSIVDAIVLGLLKLQPTSNLSLVDFTRFEKDKKLCKELCRLPVLWMKPSDRTIENLHDYMSQSVEISKDKVQRFLNRISLVYSNMEGEFKHGNKIEPITIVLDLAVVIDDVPMGLALQQCGPFKIACGRLWMKPIHDVGLSPCSLGKVLDTARITHFEYEDPHLPYDEAKIESLTEALGLLKYLFALSLPNSIDIVVNQVMAGQLNRAMKKLKHLSRLNLSYCNLKSQLQNLLDGIKPQLIYLNLKDCRLSEDDLFFLVNWKALPHLKELNLSNNNIGHMDQVIYSIVEKMKKIVCLSLSFCSLTTHSQVVLVSLCKECSWLKVLCMQGYVPLPDNDVLDMLHILSEIKAMQKIILFPESYGFPGNNEDERELNRNRLLNLSYTYLEMRGRGDIELD